ncbi:MAG: glycosyltransferase family 2 protein [Anaerolineales bacterium]|nr:glycosyltransferase family 2 protein [Anaerolineales bacterium]
MTQPLLSIIIPAYNEAGRLPRTLEQISTFLQQQDYQAEVLVVENGSQDDTLAIAQQYAQQHPICRVLQTGQRGKGLAVRQGMLAATGQYRFMCDADLSMPITEINRFLPPAIPNPEIVIASREAPGALRFDEPAYRHWGGRLINLVIRWLALPGIRDTQCGFKCFRADIAEDLFRYQRLEGIAFDPEILSIARLRGYQIIELPVPWHFAAESRIRLVRDTLQLVRDLFRIRSNARQGLYDHERQ